MFLSILLTKLLLSRLLTATKIAEHHVSNHREEYYREMAPPAAGKAGIVRRGRKTFCEV